MRLKLIGTLLYLQLGHSWKNVALMYRDRNDEWLDGHKKIK